MSDGGDEDGTEASEDGAEAGKDGTGERKPDCSTHLYVCLNMLSR